MSGEDCTSPDPSVDDGWAEAGVFARSPVIALLVMKLAYPRFVVIDGSPFHPGPDWADDPEGFTRYVRRQMEHARRRSASAAERERIPADTAEVDLGLVLNSYVVDGDRSADVLDEVAGMLRHTWKAALDQQFGPDSYRVSVVPCSAESLAGPFLRYEARATS